MIVLLVLRNVFIEFEISTTNSHHHFVTCHLNYLFLTSNEVTLCLNMCNGNGNVHLPNLLSNFSLNLVVITFFGDEWNWSGTEKFITLFIYDFIRQPIEINISMSIVMVCGVLFHQSFQPSDSLSFL